MLVDTDFGDASGRAPGLEVASWKEGTPDPAQWDELARSASEPNPFFERWFLKPSLEAFDPQGSVSLAQLQCDGRLVALVPIRLSRNYYGRPVPHFSVWLHENAFCGVPLIARGFEAMFWSALLRWVDEHAGIASFLHLPGLPEGCGPDTVLAELACESGRPLGTVEREARALLFSELSPEDYYEQSLPNKKRKELRRQARRLGEQGSVTVERATHEAEIAPWADAFLALEAASWKGRAGSSLANSDARAQFFRDTLTGAAAQGRVEGLSIRLDGEPIAMLVTFLTPPGSFSFKTAFDERFAKYSPGVLLQKENLDLLERGEISWCDSCAAPDHPMIDHFWREQRSLVSRNVAIGGHLRRAIGSRLISYESRRLERCVAS